MTRYQMIATDRNYQSIATFACGNNLAQAYERCKQEFPPAEGYTQHELWDLDTGEVYDPDDLALLFE